MDKKKEEKLFMSVKVPDSNDYIQGFGSKELAITMFGAAAAFVILILMYFITGNIAKSIAVGAIITAAVVLVVRRDNCNECLIDKLRQILQYYTGQNRYEFQYYDYLRIEPEKEKTDDRQRNNPE